MSTNRDKPSHRSFSLSFSCFTCTPFIRATFFFLPQSLFLTLAHSLISVNHSLLPSLTPSHSPFLSHFLSLLPSLFPALPISVHPSISPSLPHSHFLPTFFSRFYSFLPSLFIPPSFPHTLFHPSSFSPHSHPPYLHPSIHPSIHPYLPRSHSITSIQANSPAYHYIVSYPRIFLLPSVNRTNKRFRNEAIYISDRVGSFG